MSEPKFADTLEPFFTALHRYPLLTAAEEQTLGRQVQTMQAILSGNLIIDDELEKKRLIATGRRAKEKMINHNLRLVVKIAKRHQYQGVEFPDLIQEGVIGLNRGIELFDPDKGFKLSTYITWWIRQAITRYISNNSRTVRLPIHVTEKLNKLKLAHKALFYELQRHPTESEIAERMDISIENVKHLLGCRRSVLSLNCTVGKDEDSELGDLVAIQAHSPSCTPELFAEQQALIEAVEKLLNCLPSKERRVLKLRFGLLTGEPKSLQEVGEEFGLSRERVRQMQVKGIRKLRWHKDQLGGLLDA